MQKIKKLDIIQKINVKYTVEIMKTTVKKRKRDKPFENNYNTDKTFPQVFHIKW